MVEPEQGDIAFTPPFTAFGAGEVPEQCRAAVPGIALLNAELVGEHRVAAAGIDDEARTPFGFNAVVILDLDQRALVLAFARVHVHCVAR